MLETITKGFKTARNRLRGQVELTPANIDEALRDVRVALLEGDVDLNVVRRFIAQVQEKALGEVVALSAENARGRKIVTEPGDHFIKICHDQLEALMGPVDTSLRHAKGKPTGIMVVGLQGSGKTTTAAKLAAYLKKTQAKRPMLVAADVYRPAAVDQLQVLGKKLGVPVFNEPGVSPAEMCRHALSEALTHKNDVVIFDTAGRLAIDEQLMAELEQVKAAVQPENILLVCDAMIGQDAVRTAAEFNRRLELDGFILTKLDGDARGGAALSIKEITGKPIKFVGMGEGLDKLEEFRPEGLASRILGFGDIVGLMKDFEDVVDEDKAEEDAKKILSGNFHLGDFVEQIKLVKKMGPVSELMERFPLFGDMPEGFSFDDKALDRIQAIVGSMTEAERQEPDIITPARVKRIALGSGRKDQEVHGLLAQYRQMRQVMKQIGSAPGLLARLPGFRNIAQLRQLQGKGMDDLFGDDAGAIQAAMGGGMGMDPKAMARAAGMPAGMSPRVPAGAMAKARMMGYAPPAGKPVDKAKLREKRKRERQNRKKNRKRK
jgi:signal recognition particle subunit SRP54